MLVSLVIVSVYSVTWVTWRDDRDKDGRGRQKLTWNDFLRRCRVVRIHQQATPNSYRAMGVNFLLLLNTAWQQTALEHIVTWQVAGASRHIYPTNWQYTISVQDVQKQ